MSEIRVACLAQRALVLLLVGSHFAVARAEDAEPKLPVVLVAPAVESELAEVISYPARVSANVKATVYAPSDGVVTRVRAPLGTAVRSGTKLLEIKNIDPLYEYVPVAVDTPVAGVVSSVDVTEGTRVTKGQVLATVTDPAQKSLIVEVPAADVPYFKSGLGGEFFLPMLGERFPHAAVRVKGVSPLVDPVTGTATVELAIEQASAAAVIPLGAIGKATFAVNKRKGIQVVEQAVVYRGKETFIRVVEAGKAKMLAVVLGDTRQGQTEVIKGLKKGDVIVVRASGFVADGQAVVVQNADVAKQ